MTDRVVVPLKVTPRFDPKPWGGRRLERFGFVLPEAGPFGEAVITAADAVIVDGPFAGTTLQALVDRHPERMIGRLGLAATGDRVRFPLLIKIIDATQDLSVQVHPDDAAAEPTGQSGKTETWHLLASEPGSQIAVGLNSGVPAPALAAACRSGRGAAPLLRWLPARTGESLLIPAGTVHALGAGCVVFEAQQPSDITYRLDDWGRVDAGGRPRELHLDQGLAVCDPGWRPEPISPLQLRSATGRRHLLSACRYFALERIALASGESLPTTALASPQTVTLLRGAATVSTDAGATSLAGGETAIVSAASETARIAAKFPTILLRTWVPDLEMEIVAPALAAGHRPDEVAAMAGPLPDILRAAAGRRLIHQ